MQYNSLRRQVGPWFAALAASDQSTPKCAKTKNYPILIAHSANFTPAVQYVLAVG